MHANTSLNISELGFFEIKESLKDYLRTKSEFTDFDFEGSAMSTLLDVLSYNTYYQSYYLNMVANEMFLDSATMPESVYSISKMLNYLPRSARAGHAEITISFTPNDAPEEIVIPKYTKFQTTLNGVVYTFTTNTNYSIFATDGSYTKTIEILEGIVLSYRFTKTNDKNFFEIPVEGIDTSSLVVEILQNATSTTKRKYKLVKDATEVSSTSEVYYIQKNTNGFYEVYFGDGVLGKAILNGNVILLTFRACNGAAANDTLKFVPVGYTGYNKLAPTTKYNSKVITTNFSTKEGQVEESLENIKFNAPRSYETQNRLITVNDYKQHILNNYSDIQSVSVWGGEDHVPPIYGKCLIAVKPINGYVISTARKNAILADVQTYAPMSIDPAIIDPVFIFVKPEITVNYNSKVMATNVQSLLGRVSSAVKAFETNSLGTFGNDFRHSRMAATVDAIDNAIISNEIKISMEKRFSPEIDSKFTYQISFQNSLFHPYNGYLGCLSSTGFKVLGSTQTMYFDDDGLGIVRLYYNRGSEKVYHNSNVGTIDYATGIVVLNSMTFTDYDDEIRIIAVPAKPDVQADKNQIILLSYPTINMFDTNQERIIYSDTVDVLGNVTLVRASGLLSTVTL